MKFPVKKIILHYSYKYVDFDDYFSRVCNNKIDKQIDILRTGIEILTKYGFK